MSLGTLDAICLVAQSMIVSNITTYALNATIDIVVEYVNGEYCLTEMVTNKCTRFTDELIKYVSPSLATSEMF
jgi:hypothetical protein